MFEDSSDETEPVSSTLRPTNPKGSVGRISFVGALYCSLDALPDFYKLIVVLTVPEHQHDSTYPAGLKQASGHRRRRRPPLHKAQAQLGPDKVGPDWEPASRPAGENVPDTTFT